MLLPVFMIFSLLSPKRVAVKVPKAIPMTMLMARSNGVREFFFIQNEGYGRKCFVLVGVSVPLFLWQVLHGYTSAAQEVGTVSKAVFSAINNTLYAGLDDEFGTFDAWRIGDV